MNPIVIATEFGLSLQTHEDLNEIIGAALGKSALILTEKEIGANFFDLRTGLAGELFQKCTNYSIRLAIVLPDIHPYGQRFQELALEHRAHPSIRFFSTQNEAMHWLIESD
jgi:hypothetical protein